MRSSSIQSRREAINTARVDKKKQTMTLGCEFPCGDLVPAFGLEVGAILATGGKGGSATLDSIKGGNVACDTLYPDIYINK